MVMSFSVSWIVSIFILLAAAIPGSAGAVACLKVHRLASVALPTGEPLNLNQKALLWSKGLEPKDFVYLDAGAEGFVFLNPKTGAVTKVFKEARDLKELLLLETRLGNLMREAGFEVPRLEKVDINGQYVQRKFVHGQTLKAYDKENRISNPERLRQALGALRGRVEKLRQGISKLNLDFQDYSPDAKSEYYDLLMGYFPTVINGKPDQIQLILHDENILIREEPSGKFMFSIIDFR